MPNQFPDIFLRYAYGPSPDYTQMLADIVAVSTGAANTLNNLSATCIQVDSELTVNVASTWTVHDADAGSGAKVIQATDGITVKYLRLAIDEGGVSLQAYSTWDAQSHSGVIATNNPTQWLDLVDGGVLILTVKKLNQTQAIVAVMGGARVGLSWSDGSMIGATIPLRYRILEGDPPPETQPDGSAVILFTLPLPLQQIWSA